MSDIDTKGAVALAEARAFLRRRFPGAIEHVEQTFHTVIISGFVGRHWKCENCPAEGGVSEEERRDEELILQFL